MSNIRDELKSEYLLLQAHLESFDGKALTIKSWSAPLLATAIGLGAERQSVPLISIVIVAALSLWCLEAIWKGFQDCYVARITLIESWFRQTEAPAVPPFQIYTAWREAWGRHNQVGWIAKRAFQPFVFLPYLPIALAGVGLAMSID
ncbi:hypothetical protein [Pararhizobium gei]|uniref:hypothetical protein n=1 Tax=Pararhizobium gei TaxID=1395951 RepID=UPI0023DA2731|nr:hypothetical protein [Rhizobium gei]